MPAIIATNIRLPEEVLKALKYKAIEEKKSINRLIQEAIETFLSAPVHRAAFEKDPLDEIIGIAKSGTKDGSTKHDRFLYGKRK